MGIQNQQSSWENFQQHFLRYDSPALSLDSSRMSGLPTSWDALESGNAALLQQAFAEMVELEGGAIVNEEENRMVGHYWLRAEHLAPSVELQEQIVERREAARKFASDILSAEKFSELLLIGIGGSALGPQLVAESLATEKGLVPHFIDNCDPAGIDDILSALGNKLSQTLVLVVSKSGGTPETRNGMLEVRYCMEERGLDFNKQAVAITGQGSKLDELARAEGWLHIFPMADWVGGRTSVMSVVGLVPSALMGVDIDAFLRGAAQMDEATRSEHPSKNMAMRLALSWYVSGEGQGKKSMVVLPYRDSLSLLSRYLQQLVMESLGKHLDRDGQVVNQGLSVYGNKGSTDQHAYVQQLRDGLNNFFATFIEVQQNRDGASLDLGDGNVSGDFLQGFLRGTREALSEGQRDSISISIARADEAHLGALIALFERAVGYYASMVNVNAYHQPGVESGKKAAADFLNVLRLTEEGLRERTAGSVSDIAEKTGQDIETTWHCLNHLAANKSDIDRAIGESPAEDQYSVQA